MARNFYFKDVKIKKHDQERWLMVKGEVINESGKDYNAVSFRAVVFVRTIPVGNSAFVISGMRHGQSRIFEVQMGELEYDKIGREITKCDLCVEDAY